MNSYRKDALSKHWLLKCQLLLLLSSYFWRDTHPPACCGAIKVGECHFWGRLGDGELRKVCMSFSLHPPSLENSPTPPFPGVWGHWAYDKQSWAAIVSLSWVVHQKRRWGWSLWPPAAPHLPPHPVHKLRAGQCLPPRAFHVTRHQRDEGLPTCLLYWKRCNRVKKWSKRKITPET